MRTKSNDAHVSSRARPSGGLSRSQQYYRSHPDVKAKNRERQRLRRQRTKHLNAAASLESDIASMLSDFSGTPTLAGMLEAVSLWSSNWGSTDYWPVLLRRNHENAIQQGSFDIWEEQLLDHAALGRQLLNLIMECREVKGMGSHRYKNRELWRVGFEMVKTLVRGISTIEDYCYLVIGAGSAAGNSSSTGQRCSQQDGQRRASLQSYGDNSVDDQGDDNCGEDASEIEGEVEARDVEEADEVGDDDDEEGEEEDEADDQGTDLDAHEGDSESEEETRELTRAGGRSYLRYDSPLV